MGWGDDYLRILREEPSLSIPFVDRLAVAGRLGMPVKTLNLRLAMRDDLRMAEQEIVAEHLGLAGLGAGREGVEGAENPSLLPAPDDLPLPLMRYIEVYQETDSRIGAIDRCVEEGIPLTLDDVLEGMQRFPEFGKMMRKLWQKGDLDVEDRLREKAREGKGGSVALYLRGNMPEKYGNKVKVDVDVNHHFLQEEDRSLVDAVKQKHMPKPPRRRALEDVVEGEVIAEIDKKEVN